MPKKGRLVLVLANNIEAKFRAYKLHQAKWLLQNHQIILFLYNLKLTSHIDINFCKTGFTLSATGVSGIGIPAAKGWPGCLVRRDVCACGRIWRCHEKTSACVMASISILLDLSTGFKSCTCQLPLRSYLELWVTYMASKDLNKARHTQENNLFPISPPP